MKRYVMTARRKAALRKAQLASARIRKKNNRVKKHLRKKHSKVKPLTNGQVYAIRAIGVSVGSVLGALAYKGSKDARLINQTLAKHQAYKKMKF